MDKFVKSVNTMDETILVPCRLMDLKVGDELDPVIKNCSSRTVKELLRSADLYKVYNMIHDVKGDLVWGRESNTPSSKRQGHVRRPSTASVASSSSLNSDSESDGGTETDSGIEEVQDNFANNTELVTTDFRMHLAGLTNSLKQMTEAAQYLTSRYQHDIGGS